MLYQRSYRRAAALLLLALLASWIPSAATGPWASVTPPVAAAAASTTPPAIAVARGTPVAPTPFSPTPGLAMAVQLAPDPLAVGETATISVTITNRTPYPADHLVVTAPTPDGALAQSGSGQISPTRGWQWSLARLDGLASAVVTGTLQLVRVPPGAALLASASATADLLAAPAHATGGALVVDRTRGPAIAAFTPGAAATLRSQDGRVVVRFPPNAAKQALTLRHTPLAGFEQIGPPDQQGFRRSLDRFALDASTLTGAALHQFDAPLTLSVSYTPEQLQARGLRDIDLTLFWFDDAAQRWTPLPTDVDASTHTVSAPVDHFTAFALSDGMSASELYIPSLQGFQTSSFTGAASYHIAIDTPSGAGGLKPSLGLNYSSAASDGSGGDRDKWQASWVGKGWSLDAEGYVARNRSLAGDAWDHFTLVFGGRSFDVVRGQLTNTSGCTTYANTTALQCWTWQSTDENFTRVRAEASGSDYLWRAWTTDGTRYDFTTVLNDQPDPTDSILVQSYKWLLTQVTDAHGNSITYNYQIDQVSVGSTWVHPTYCLTEILWGYDGGSPSTPTPGTGTPRFRAEFVPAADAISGTIGRHVSNNHGNTTGVDLDYEYPNIGNAHWQQVTPHEQYRLDQINIYSQPSSGWQLMRRYDLYYASADDTTTPNVKTDSVGGQFVLTLKQVQQTGKDGTTVLPATSFTYNLRGNAQTPAAGGNRLHTISNGQGGTLTFGYQNVWGAGAFPPPEASYYYENYHRLSSVTTTNSAGPSSTTLATYDYTNPARNDIGYAATVEFAAFPPSGNGDSRQLLAQPEKREFRGHATVIERQYAGATTGTALLQEQQTWFYQGNGGTGTATCTPATKKVGGNTAVIETDACYQTMLKRESWKGRAYQTEVRNGSASTTLLQRTVHTFARIDLPFFGSDSTVANSASLSNNYKRAGLWRVFTPEIQTDTQTFELNTTTAQTKTTKTFYNADCTTDTTATIQASYGNIGCVQEQDGTTLVRKTLKYYKMTDGPLSGGVWGPYIVDRMWGEATYNSGGGLLALSHMFYDTTTNPNDGALSLSTGELQRVIKYYDLPVTCCTNPIHGLDMTYSYDAFGNRLTETSYAQAGFYTPSSTTWSTPGNGSTARTTTTGYDDSGTATINEAYSGLPRQITNPLSQSESATYDYQLGTLTSVTDANSQSTSAEYDAFGRMVKLIKPGDSSASPTLLATYDDFAQPFRYIVQQKDTSSDGVRTSTQFYDGIGRKIQTKTESADGVNAIVSVVNDTRYDALARLVAQSQPFYHTESSTDFSYTTPVSTTLTNQTTTTYDALGRPLVITTPDTATSEHHYGVSGSTTYDDVIDPNRHRMQRRYDALGRLVEVDEIAGNCGNYWPAYACGGSFTTPWTVYAITSYAYSPLDLLSSVTDAKGNLTSMQYDSLGRKASMSDPDMGNWSYSYDANGNLLSQVDAKNQQICFYYDALNRLTGKHFQANGTCPGALASGDVFYNYDEAAAVNGKGQRTSMSNPNATTEWEYDARGRKTKETYSNVTGLAANQTRVFEWSYDSADRVSSITYPSSEQVGYTYDAGWRQTSGCSASDCYVGDAANTIPATYTALDQPLSWQFGNSAIQQWTYDSPMQRLQRIQAGTAISPTLLMHRSYTYDDGGNVKTIGDTNISQTQNFDYDERDRLVHYETTSGATFAMPLALATRPGLAPALSLSGPQPSSALPARIAPDRALLNPNLALALDAPDAASEPARGEQTIAPAPAAPTAQTDTATAAAAPSRPDFSRLPLAFVPNQGLTDARARFVVRSGLSTLFFTPDEVVLALPDASPTISTTIARLRYEGANPNPTLSAGTPLPGVANYFIGTNPALWQTNVPTYAGLSYTSLYNGIDLRYDGADGKLKSTYLVAPGADPAQIRWRYPGATAVQLDSASGDLLIAMPAPGAGRSGRTLIEHAPVAWQEVNGQRITVSAHFAVGADQSVSFALGSYDATQRLSIDPVLSYSSYLGGAGGDDGQGIAVDASGNMYVAGSTRSSNFPLSSSPFQSSRNGAQDAFVTKLNASGSTVLYSTYLGGSLEDEAHAIAIDASGYIYLTGETRSTNFPLKNALDGTFGGGTCNSQNCNDVFVTKLDPSQSTPSNQLKYSTYIGGSGEDVGYGIATDGSGNAFVTGVIAGGLPIPSKTYDNSLGGSTDAFLIKINTASSGSSSNLYATYLGGSSDETGQGVAVDGSGNVYVTGETNSSAYPTKNAYQGSKAGSDDAFVTKLNPTVNGSGSLLYSTYLGGSASDNGNAIALDSSGKAYVTGYTDSTAWPTVTPWQSAKAGAKDAFLAKVDASQSGTPSLTYSTYLGGIAEDRGLGIAVESADLVYLTGYTRSITYPTALAPQPAFGGGTCGTISCTDSFITAFDLSANAPVYSTFLGGSNNEQGEAIAVDASGAAYVAGITYSSDYPTASPRQGTFGGGTQDAFVAKLTQPTVALEAATASVNEASATATLTVTLSAAETYTATVGYTTSDGTASAGSDYTAVSSTLNFAPGVTSQAISIPILDDTLDEPDETLSVTLNSPTNARLATPSSTTVTITDDDPTPTVGWQASNFNVGEAAGSGLATALLSAASSFTVTVDYATSDDTASAGSDYTSTSGTLTFAPGQVSQSLAISITNDTAIESSETISLTLSSPTNATLGTASATMTILDDDGGALPAEEFYTYDQIGNLLSKTGVGTYVYPAAGSAHPHAVSSVTSATGTITYTYDANGNMTGRGGLLTTWDEENRPLTISTTSGSESYAYDADGERVKVVAGSTTTVYLGGLWEETSAGATKAYYTFGGQTVAVRDSSEPTDPVSYLHGDHLGSVSVASGAGASLLSSQRFDPWGKVISGAISQTQKNYTGQYLDTTGLLYYHARYYDPVLARFVSADTVVPGADALTVGLAKKSNGPDDPQQLNRYAYVNNNPLTDTDPTGHCVPYVGDCRPFWEKNVTYTGWEDFKQYSAGVVEGMGAPGAVAASLLKPETYQKAYQGAENLIADPKGSAVYLREKLVDPVVRGAEFLVKDPAGAGAALNNDPRGVGRVLGITAGTASLSEAALSGREIKLGPNLRIAPFGNRTGNPAGELPHYHRRGIGPNGDTLPGQGIGRHRPWDTKSPDTSFWDRF